jgi:hypothetical protein
MTSQLELSSIGVRFSAEPYFVKAVESTTKSLDKRIAQLSELIDADHVSQLGKLRENALDITKEVAKGNFERLDEIDRMAVEEKRLVKAIKHLGRNLAKMFEERNALEMEKERFERQVEMFHRLLRSEGC